MMRGRVRLLNFTVAVTVTLLLLGALLVVLGIFNEYLNWDIFGPRIEALLYAVFMSSLGLAGFGVALTVVLGIQEVVQAFRVIQRERGEPARPEATRTKYLAYMAVVAVVLGVVVSGLNSLDNRVTAHRSRVFKGLAAAQMNHFAPRIATALESVLPTPDSDVPPPFFELLATLEDLDFVQGVSVFRLDPGDNSAMLRYEQRLDEYKPGEVRFERFFIARDSDKDIKEALEGNPAPLEALCKRLPFVYCHVIVNAVNRPAAVLRIQGNASENFREYSLGS